jgi:hypothetical protein
MFKRIAVAATVVSALLLGSTGVADASPLHYTKRHCYLFAVAFEDQRWAAAGKQVYYLSVPPSIQPVRRDAQRLLADPTQHKLYVLARDCANLF